MYQEIMCQDRYWIVKLINADQWDGIGYPENVTSVWACLLNNEQELLDLKAFWEKIKESSIIDDIVI